MAKLQAVMSLMNDATLNSFPSVNGQITEQDIIKFLVDHSETFNAKRSAKLAPQQLFNKNNDDQFS